MFEQQIREYVEKSDCMDKAGAYAIQDMKKYSQNITHKFDIVEYYKGDFDNIVGLPVNKLKYKLIEKQLYKV
jgi:predicted house-cleaning NTP pyrophosphatase (Maf/HAM1 superfamily)